MADERRARLFFAGCRRGAHVLIVDWRRLRLRLCIIKLAYLLAFTCS